VLTACSEITHSSHNFDNSIIHKNAQKLSVTAQRFFNVNCVQPLKIDWREIFNPKSWKLRCCYSLFWEVVRKPLKQMVKSTQKWRNGVNFSHKVEKWVVSIHFFCYFVRKPLKNGETLSTVNNSIQKWIKSGNLIQQMEKNLLTVKKWWKLYWISEKRAHNHTTNSLLKEFVRKPSGYGQNWKN
jgi:hypothetical protein